MLEHPRVSVIGSTDLARTAAFFSVFGARPQRLPDVDADAAAALYGVEGAVEQWTMVTPGVDHHQLVLVATPHDAVPFAPLTAGAYGLDYFSTDIELTLRLLAGAGATDASPLVGYGPDPVQHDGDPARWRNYEARLLAPDDISIFVTDILRSEQSLYPTLLDDEPERLHSEMLQLCWVSDDIEADLAFWTGEAGLRLMGDGFPDSAEMARLMNHPRSTPLRDLALGAVGPTRFRTKIELMAYPEETVTRRPDWPLRGGLHAAGFLVDDLEQTMTDLHSASFGDVVEVDRGQGRQACVTATSPDQLRFELWERPGA